MIPLQNVDTVWEFLAVVASLIGAVAVAATPIVLAQHKHNRDTSAKLDAVQGQVVNGHEGKPPLRADMDRALVMLETFGAQLEGLGGLVRNQGRDISGIREDVGLIRGDQREDRRNLTALETRVAQMARREQHGEPP